MFNFQAPLSLLGYPSISSCILRKHGPRIRPALFFFTTFHPSGRKTKSIWDLLFLMGEIFPRALGYFAHVYHAVATDELLQQPGGSVQAHLFGSSYPSFLVNDSVEIPYLTSGQVVGIVMVIFLKKVQFASLLTGAYTFSRSKPPSSVWKEACIKLPTTISPCCRGCTLSSFRRIVTPAALLSSNPLHMVWSVSLKQSVIFGAG